MMSFETILVREKFRILSPEDPSKSNSGILDVVSNRMTLNLENPETKKIIHFVIRTKHMHECVRLAAHILKSYEEKAVIRAQSTSFDWKGAWKYASSPFVSEYSESWAVVYADGMPIFEINNRHAFWDLIERCNIIKGYDYNSAFALAQEGLHKADNLAHMEYFSKHALAVHEYDGGLKHGLILRGPTRTLTFSYTVKSRDNEPFDKYYISISATAAFLESMQLDFMLADTAKVSGTQNRSRKTQDALARLDVLKKEIDALENIYAVNYRPERPRFASAFNSEIRK